MASANVEGLLKCDHASDNESVATIVVAAADIDVLQPTTCRLAATASLLGVEEHTTIHARDAHNESSCAAAAAVAMVKAESGTSSGGESLDKFLLAALKSQDRLFLLRLDRVYCNFIENNKRFVPGSNLSELWGS